MPIETRRGLEDGLVNEGVYFGRLESTDHVACLQILQRIVYLVRKSKVKPALFDASWDPTSRMRIRHAVYHIGC